MKAKRLFILLAVAALMLSLAGLSAGLGEDVSGTVTKIEGNSVTIKDTMGGEKTIEPKNPEALKDLKVGDRAAVKDGMVTKEAGAGPSSPAPGPRYRY